MSAKHTPLPWKVRKHPELGCFIEAKIPGKPYGQEIMGDDYFPELSREADAEFIVALTESRATLTDLLVWLDRNLVGDHGRGDVEGWRKELGDKIDAIRTEL